MTYARILATGSALPEHVVTNADLQKLVDTNDEWIRTRTGIRERRVAVAGETTGDLAFRAAQQALHDAGVKASDLDLVIVGTTTPDVVFPATACAVQNRLGANGCAAFDLNAACSSFVYGLSVADGLVRAGQAKRVLVIGAETISRLLDWTDRQTCVLFGDGAGAVVVGDSNEPGVLTTRLHADGGYNELLYSTVGVSAGFTDEKNHGIRIHMAGREVFKIAVKTLDALVDETLAAANMPVEQLDWFIPHQANLRIIEAMAKRHGMSMDQVVVTVDKHANTSSASVPLALDTAVRSGRIKRGDNVLLEAFGAGLTWASALLKY